MADNEEYQRNVASYQRLKEAIRKAYPLGWFVGIADDQIVGAAADLRALEADLRAQGKDPRRVLVVEAGVDYPEHVTLFVWGVSRGAALAGLGTMARFGRGPTAKGRNGAPREGLYQTQAC
jgi:hypothetical protein